MGENLKGGFFFVQGSYQNILALEGNFVMVFFRGQDFFFTPLLSVVWLKNAFIKNFLFNTAYIVSYLQRIIGGDLWDSQLYALNVWRFECDVVNKTNLVYFIWLFILNIFWVKPCCLTLCSIYLQTRFRCTIPKNCYNQTSAIFFSCARNWQTHPAWRNMLSYIFNHSS